MTCYMDFTQKWCRTIHVIHLYSFALKIVNSSIVLCAILCFFHTWVTCISGALSSLGTSCHTVFRFFVHFAVCIVLRGLDWIEQSLTSHQTHYRSYWGWILCCVLWRIKLIHWLKHLSLYVHFMFFFSSTLSSRL